MAKEKTSMKFEDRVKAFLAATSYGTNAAPGIHVVSSVNSQGRLQFSLTRYVKPSTAGGKPPVNSSMILEVENLKQLKTWLDSLDLE